MIMAAAALLAGCAMREAAVSAPEAPRADYADAFNEGRNDAWAEAYAAGGRDTLARIRNSQPFNRPVPSDNHRPDEVSWLPRTPKIDDDHWWDSRKRNFELIEACRDAGKLKDKLIEDMRATVSQAR
ncbi:hypothetical protein [Salinisphaera sp. T31B1]|uniref:hypothetical protein n=1 Tax=Salinisphaera sp. T31B1 TaxID=727963 RepID=UPI00333FBAB5